MDVLMIGNNVKHAELFKEFANNVFLVISKNQDGLNRNLVEQKDFKIILSDVRKNSFFGFIKRVHEIRKWTRNNKNIEIVFTNRKDDLIASKLSFLFKRKRNRPLIISTFHNSLAWQSKIKKSLISFLIKHFSDGCICLSKKVYDFLISKKTRSEKLLFLPNVVQFQNYYQKQDYSINNKLEIVYVGSIYENKNQSFILKVVGLVSQTHPNIKIHVTFFGESLNPTYKKQLDDMINTLHIKNDVFFRGDVDNHLIRKELPKFDLYFSASKCEMSPYNILEAKASALPILCSHAFGQEDLIDDGFDGILFDDDNLQDAVKKMDKLLDNYELRKKIGSNAFLSISSFKSYLVASKQLHNFIEQLR